MSDDDPVNEAELEVLRRVEEAILERQPQPGHHAYQVRKDGWAFVLQVIPEWRILEVRGPHGNVPVTGALKDWNGVRP